MIRTRRYADVTLGVNNRGNSAVQIGDQVWTTKNFNESVVGSLIIPEIQNATNTELITNIADREFSSDTGFWSKVGGFLIQDNVCKVNATSSERIERANALIIGRYYKVTFTISNKTGNASYGIKLQRPSDPTTSGLNVSTTYTTDGTYTVFGRAQGVTLLFSCFGITGQYSLDLDNVSYELIGWASMDTIPTPADRLGWCNYNNLQVNGDIYGKLYNWWTVNEINNQLIALNSDWRVPTSTQFTTLQTTLGGQAVAGGKMKEVGTLKWNAPNTGATNESGFSAIPAGYKDYITGNSVGMTLYNQLYLISEIDASNADTYYLLNNASSVIKQTLNKKYGLSLRLIKK